MERYHRDSSAGKLSAGFGHSMIWECSADIELGRSVQRHTNYVFSLVQQQKVIECIFLTWRFFFYAILGSVESWCVVVNLATSHVGKNELFLWGIWLFVLLIRKRWLGQEIPRGVGRPPKQVLNWSYPRKFHSQVVEHLSKQ